MHTDTSKPKDSWRERIKRSRKPFDPEKEIEKETKPTEDDVEMVHPINKSRVRIKDDGSIEAFADKGLGFRINPTTRSILFFADNFQIISPEVHLKTDDKGFKWNYCPLNPDMKDPFREIVTTRRFGTNMLERVLNTAGMYANAGGPVSPAGATGLMSYIDLEGSRVYDNSLPVEAQKIASVGKGAAKILKDMGSNFDFKL